MERTSAVSTTSPTPGPSQHFDREWLREWARAHSPQMPQARLVLELLADLEEANQVNGRWVADQLKSSFRRLQDRRCLKTELMRLADDGCPHG